MTRAEGLNYAMAAIFSVDLPTVGSGLSLTLSSTHGTLFLLGRCLIRTCYEGLHLVLLYLIASCLVDIPGKFVFFFFLKEKRVDLGEMRGGAWELEGVERGSCI